MASRFDTRVLDRALARKRQERERLRHAVQAQALRLLDESPVEIGEAILFGSVVRPGCFDAASDVDIAIPAVDPRAYFMLLGHFEDGLERDVDLVALDTCHFADTIRRTGLRWTGIHT